MSTARMNIDMESYGYKKNIHCQLQSYTDTEIEIALHTVVKICPYNMMKSKHAALVIKPDVRSTLWYSESDRKL